MGSKIFTALDLASGYHQVRIHPDDDPRTAFTTTLSHFEWLVLPFGQSNAPATFQTLTNHIFTPYLNHFVTVYLDDALNFSRSKTEGAAPLYCSVYIVVVSVTCVLEVCSVPRYPGGLICALTSFGVCLWSMALTSFGVPCCRSVDA